MLPILLLASCIALFVAGVALFVAGVRADSTRMLIASLVVAASSAVPGISLGACGPYIAGQGDAPDEARAWVAKFRPGWTVGECQPRDTDDNDYVTCTLLGPPGSEPEPIECGVNRWFHGFRVTGCKQLIYARDAK